ncbi:hypothetical protein FSP39_011432 [Pinctada imbricata]|uniref:Sushi domain-containing protein n=1 Tax=Pinctada imbricata TaxID=66713 RepID=A0AA89C672_PINIB|nr:hypothetical protein FSP39_011432 [Pinctada imbricata]
MTDCTQPPIVSNGYPVNFVSSVKSGGAVTVSCNSGYVLKGGAQFTCGGPAYYGNASCVHWYEEDVWFWALIALLCLLVIASIICLSVYCYRRCCRRGSRVRPFRDEEDSVGQGACGGCCDYGGSCDVCGCIDYYGCCSLYGCFGYRGFCACCCECCRCCREPDEEHVHNNRSLKVSKNRRGKLSRKTSMKARRRKQKLWQRWRSNRPQHPLDDEVLEKVRKQAKVVAIWMPHKNPVRSYNTSTK